MSIALESFIGKLSNIVRPNRFLCQVTPPTGMGLPDNTETLQFYIQSATLPDRTFGEFEMKYYGMTLKIPGNESLSDLSITVINDADWNHRNFFEQWANLVNDRSTSEKAYMQDLYNGSSVHVQQLGDKGNVITEYKFYHIYPKVVAEIELNMETTDSMETFQITFGYSYWEQLEVTE